MIDNVPIPKFAGTAVSPALHRAVRQQGTRVEGPQSDARRRRDARHLNGVGARGPGPVPELAVAVLAPAFHRAVRQQGTRVIKALRNVRRRRDTRNLDRDSVTGYVMPTNDLPGIQQGTRAISAHSNTYHRCQF